MAMPFSELRRFFDVRLLYRHLNAVRGFRTNMACFLDDKPKPPPEFTTWPGKEFSTAWQIKDKGVIYDKKPFKIKCVKGKKYMWCACGLSKTQPLCDGTHKKPFTKTTLRPVQFIAPEDKEYWFCNCKQTDNKPFCDGTHKREDIQAAIKT